MQPYCTLSKIVKDQVEVDKTFKADIEEIEASLKRK